MTSSERLRGENLGSASISTTTPIHTCVEIKARTPASSKQRHHPITAEKDSPTSPCLRRTNEQINHYPLTQPPSQPPKSGALTLVKSDLCQPQESPTKTPPARTSRPLGLLPVNSTSPTSSTTHAQVSEILLSHVAKGGYLHLPFVPCAFTRLFNTAPPCFFPFATRCASSASALLARWIRQCCSESDD